MLDDGTSDLIGKIYAGMQSPTDWDTVLDALLSRTDGRFVMVSTVDMRRQEYSSSRFYGCDDGRFLNGVADYEAERYRDDPTLKFGCRYPDAGSVSLRRILDDHASDPADREYGRWLESQFGASESLVLYTPPIDDLIFGVSLHKRAGDPVHTGNELRTFFLLFGHMANAVRMTMRPRCRMGRRHCYLSIDAAWCATPVMRRCR